MVDGERLGSVDLERLEREASAGSVEAMIQFADDALDHFQDDFPEMNRRKRLLIDANNIGNIAVLRRVCGLAARTADLETCRFIVSLVEREGGPDLGYYCYKDALARGDDTDDWRALLRSSAACGYLPARKRLAALETRDQSFLLYPVYWVRCAKILTDTISIALNDPGDQRLPPWTRDRLKKRRSAR